MGSAGVSSAPAYSATPARATRVHHPIDRSAAAEAAARAHEQPLAAAGRLRRAEALPDERVVDEGVFVPVGVQRLGMGLRRIAAFEQQDREARIARQLGG